MGYLDNSSVTIDAILTLKGRELLARVSVIVNWTSHVWICHITAMII